MHSSHVPSDLPLAAEMAFVFGNVTVYVDPADLSWGAQQSLDGWCDGGVQANDQVKLQPVCPNTHLMGFSQVIGGDWLLGDTFLRVGSPSEIKNCL